MGRLSLSVGWQNGPEPKIVSFSPLTSLLYNKLDIVAYTNQSTDSTGGSTVLSVGWQNGPEPKIVSFSP